MHWFQDTGEPSCKVQLLVKVGENVTRETAAPAADVVLQVPLAGCTLPKACLPSVSWSIESVPAAAADVAATADVPEVAEGIYEKLRTQWLKLQKHSDAVRIAVVQQKHSSQA
jgi:hypothetical protein